LLNGGLRITPWVAVLFQLKRATVKTDGRSRDAALPKESPGSRLCLCAWALRRDARALVDHSVPSTSRKVRVSSTRLEREWLDVP